jgi:phosphonoacetate hydrolase
MASHTRMLEINGRSYAWPSEPLVVVCVDGSQPTYIEEAIAAGAMPFTKAMLRRGADLRGRCVVPSFTNPNNLSIVTGQPPSVHGICGNYLLDPDTGEEVMMNDPRFLNAGTILKAFCDAGAEVAVVTAKDKLCRLLGHGLDFGSGRAVCFSAERAERANLAENGIENVPHMVGLPVPDVYSAALSEFIFAAGVKLMERRPPQIMYLSTTDYVQHKHAPGTPEANAFYAMMDRYWGALDQLGARLAITADHGMSAKHDADGNPQVIYLQSLLDGWLGEGKARVILPITDPYVVHHGALGGYATAYLSAGADAPSLVSRLAGVNGVELALSGDEAAARFELPRTRLGDLVVISDQDSVIGTSPERHDLSGLNEPLRSHGGLSEEIVPLVFNRPVHGLEPGRGLRNFDVFDVALNYADRIDEEMAS